jgi:hypothetical protein
MCTVAAAVAAASGAASVRVWHITSRGWDPWTERPLPEVVRVAYPLELALNLVKNHPELFEIAHEYEFADFQKAIQHASRPGKTGIVLLKSSN